MKTFIVLITLSICMGACKKAPSHDDMPPLLQGATSVGGSGYNCETREAPAKNPNFAQSPEMVARLREAFPPGSSAERLRLSLVQEGFEFEGSCTAGPGTVVNPSIKWAQYRKNGNEVFANVYWRETADGRVIWTFGDVAYTFL